MKKAVEKQHAYKRIEKDLNDGLIKNVLLLFGQEQYLVKWSVDIVIKRFVNSECKVFDFAEIEPENATVDNIIESCETLSLFSEKRVVCLSDFSPVAGGKLKSFPESDEKHLADYINNIPDTCLLIITAEKADKRKKLYKEIASCGSVYDFGQLDERTLRNFIVKRFHALGKSAGDQAITELIQQSGYFHKETDYTLFNIDNEIKKIAAHASGAEILISDVLETVTGDIETNIFAMIDAASKNRKDETFRLLYNLLGSDVGVFQILALLASQFEIMLEFKELKNEGKRFDEIHSILNVHEFRVKKAAAVAGAYSIPQLKVILSSIYQVEINIKTGIMEAAPALEVLIAGV